MTKAAFDLKPALLKLHISARAGALGKMIGSYRSTFRGHGLEFDGYRSYSPDDDSHLIDWKASARTDDVLVKQFVEERHQNVFILVDVSESMLHGSADWPLKIQFASEVAATIAFAVLAADDRIGFGLFSHSLMSSHEPKQGQQQFYSFTRELVNPSHYGGQVRLKTVLEEAIRFIPENSVVIILSDFIDLQGAWEKSFKVFCKKFDVLCIVVQDLFDRTLPDEPVALALEHPRTGEQLVVMANEEKQQFERRARAYLAHLESVFSHAGADSLVLTTNEHYVKHLLRFFHERQRRRR